MHMKQETISRIRQAGEYQKKAVMALFPERAQEHLAVIERELKMMAMETLVELMDACKKEEEDKKEQSTSEKPGVKRVHIIADDK